jgi:hypothetical protein
LIPEGLEVAGRLAEVEVNAASGVATWSVIGAPLARTGQSAPAPVTRETVHDRLDRIDSTLAQVFHGGELAEIGGPPIISDQLRGRVVTGNWTQSVGINWGRISDFGVLRASPPVGSAVIIEAQGLIDWRQQDLEFALAWAGGPAGHVANARVEGRTVPFNMIMGVHVTATAVVAASGNQLRCHLSAAISPPYLATSMAGGGPNPPLNLELPLPWNTFALEGHGIRPNGADAGFAPGSSTSLNLVARFGAGAAGQDVRMTTTKVTYYGGAAP